MYPSWCAAVLFTASLSFAAEPPVGYYRYPAVWGETVVFTAEGDLWRVGIEGGAAQRLTSHPARETKAAISPDGTQIAFIGEYEGPAELYLMPVAGGLPRRLTYEGGRAGVAGWTPEGSILYAASRYSTLPDQQLIRIDPVTLARTPVPLSQASEGCYDAEGNLFFTRLPWPGSYTKRYRGGSAQQIWRFDPGATEARLLTGDYPGTSRWPMCWQDRVYFVSDRDGWLNLWSMDASGGDCRQLTRHTGWDVRSPALSSGRIVYQLGADLWRCDLTTGRSEKIEITLPSDFDQRREHWIEKPLDYLSAAHLSPKGDRVAVTARGRVFVLPTEYGRSIEVTRHSGVRYREARFWPHDGKLSLLSDESGEVEVWCASADGLGPLEQLTRDGQALRFDAAPSPDGEWVAYADKNQELWVYNLKRKKATRIDASRWENHAALTWSPDSRWLAFVNYADNLFARIFVCELSTFTVRPVTSDRWNSHGPAWSPDGDWLYFLSDRDLSSVVGSPWGQRHPEPFLDRSVGIYALALEAGLRSPFRPADELSDGATSGTASTDAGGEGKQSRGEKDRAADKKGKGGDAPPQVSIAWEGLETRLSKVPVEPGNYYGLEVNATRLVFLSREAGAESSELVAVDIGNDLEAGVLPVHTITDGVSGFELSADGAKLLLRKPDGLFVTDASAEEGADLSDAQLDLSAWRFSLDPMEEWHQMFDEAWRLERDYFYDRNMHGVDWPAVREKYRPLVSRVTSREELADIFGEMIGELSALHMYVYGGEFRRGRDDVDPASLGAVLRADDAAGGWVIDRIYRSDPDEPETLAPLARPEVSARVGEVIEAINGVTLGEERVAAALLRAQAGRQVRLRIRGESGARDAIVTPISSAQEYELRYDDWEYSRRLAVEQAGGGEIGYVHLRAMGPDDYAQWARDFYPVANRKGVIVDVRHNDGGSIDSWILNRLIRSAWMWWQPRVGDPYPNMQGAFIGHLVVICDEGTVSDGEAFAEGFRRLGLGKVIGTRTVGGEIWLTSSNTLVDGGIATAAEFGVYGPEGKWLIEGHGVDPDIVVDNLPHATYQGADAQLEAAIRHLKERIAAEPVVVPPPPAFPDKSLR
ncbi:MAG: PD40 domain-containing protein [Candidatus Eisenbacteria bacterium]|nr:PD40 domain-containing protein [Candidatus Eisenbacteria bacterium]